MSHFHQPRRGWLPKMLDGLKLLVLGAFLLGYLAIAFQPSSIRYQAQLPDEDEQVKEDSSTLVEFQHTRPSR